MEKIKVTRVFEGTESAKDLLLSLVLKRIDDTAKNVYINGVAHPVREAGESA